MWLASQDSRELLVVSDRGSEVKMKITRRVVFLPALLACLATPVLAVNGGYSLVGWNNLGMHCMDPDYAVFALLPPYNTIHAQLMDASGHLVTVPGGVTVTYQGVADPTGSINVSSQGKTNFWQYVQALFGANPAPDMGLAGKGMPGSANTPQPMTFDPAKSWFIAEGIPITPRDDAGQPNRYPMMRLVARNAQGVELAQTDIVLPVSDEMQCSTCHATGGDPGAQPISGWVDLPDPMRDYRLNILRLHDERRAGSMVYPNALAAAGYNAGGLYATVTIDGKPVLCAHCHASEALAAPGFAGVPPLTRSIHSRHATVMDDDTGMSLDSLDNRKACYTCHPGSTTRCLRGAMGRAVAADGTLAIQCQSCHGNMSAVAAADRTGWLDEPTCQSCHTGTAAVNAGQIRFTSVFGTDGKPRQPVVPAYATNPDTPATGLSLYRFSKGHGGLACEACHGSTHAEWPAVHPNDNIQSTLLQGHEGVIAECDTCHNAQPSTVTGGPHGMHPVGQGWVSGHKSPGGHEASCAPCHGTDYRGTVLSRMSADRTLSAFGTRSFWRGSMIGCYTCHNGPNSENANRNKPPVASNGSVTTVKNTPATVHLVATDADANPLTLSVISQPSHGTVGLVGTTATYYPEQDYAGADTFTFAAWDGSTSSNLATVALTVNEPPCSTHVVGPASLTGTVGVPVQLSVTVTTTCPDTVTYDWDFGDGTAHATEASPAHIYAAAGSYTFHLVVLVGSSTYPVNGTVVVSDVPPSSRYFLFVTHAPGVSGTSWTTDLAVLNVSGRSADMTLVFHFASGDVQKTQTLAANGLVEWPDVVASLFEVSGDAQGPVTVVSTAPVLITTRVRTPFGGGTMGQSYPAVSASDAIGPGEDGFLSQLRGDAAYRTDIGMVNASDAEAVVLVYLYGPDGTQLGKTLGVRVPAGGWVQLTRAFAMAGVASAPLGWARVSVAGDGARIWAYASVIDNVTGDPATVLMLRR
jgi:PKD repeat protein